MIILRNYLIYIAFTVSALAVSPFTVLVHIGTHAFTPISQHLFCWKSAWGCQNPLSHSQSQNFLGIYDHIPASTLPILMTALLRWYKHSPWLQVSHTKLSLWNWDRITLWGILLALPFICSTFILVLFSQFLTGFFVCFFRKTS